MLIAAVQTGIRAWHRHPTTLERGCTLAGLMALAIAQPLFDVLRPSPEFFVARNTSMADALGATALICVGLPATLLMVERLLRRISQRLATAFFVAVVAVLVALIVLPWMLRNAVAGPGIMVSIAVVAGTLIAAGAWRFTTLRQLLVALAPAALAVPVLFFANGEVRGALAPPTTRLVTPALARTPPIVVIVFDEFPLHSLLDADGQIDAVRYPHFAALSRDGSWFREASTVSSNTIWAVPAIASGRYPTAPNAVPTLRYYPENLFTLLADRYEMFVFGRFLQLCPADTCHLDLEGPGDGPWSLVADLSVVWLHIVTPEPFAEALPPIVGDWRGFAEARRWRTSDGQRVRNDRNSEFDRFVSIIDRRSGRLYFLHTMLPHMPFEYLPSGRRYDAPDYQSRKEGGEGLFQRVDAAYADALHQRHLLQVGFVDALIGRLVRHLRDLGTFDEALLVVTADHGATYRERMPRRSVGRHNAADILRVPLFVKAPGQLAGGPVDRSAETVDILPTIADVLGMRLPFAVDGRSLLGPDVPARLGLTFIDRTFANVIRRDVRDWRPSSEASLGRRLARFGSGAARTLYAVPGTEDLLDREAGALAHRPGNVRVTVAVSAQFRSVDLSRQTLPLHVRGRVLGRSGQPLAVVVNGLIAATTMPYLERGATVFATMVPEQALRAGRNDVSLFFVERGINGTTLVTTLK